MTYIGDVRYNYEVLDVQIVKKPPQSPYLNVLYLRYFTSNLSLKQTKKDLTVKKLVSNLQ